MRHLGGISTICMFLFCLPVFAVEPQVTHVGLLAPDILGITIEEGRVIRGDIVSYTAQPGDVLVNDPPPTEQGDPRWVERDGQGYLQPLTQPGEWNTRQAIQFQGPALIYPMNRISATPLDTFTVLDIVRVTLGVGPCQYILDTEAGKSTNRGMATCGARDRLDHIYATGAQKERRAQVEKALDDVVTFIRFIRSRIDTYVAFGHGCLDYMAEQKADHPELAASLAELETLARTIDARVAARRELIKTPEYAAELADEFRRTVLDKEDPEALARCQKITAAWVEIGGNQDHLAGECRWAVKFVRQRAGLLMAEDPRVAEVCREIRRRAQVAMENPAGHEAIHH